MESDAILNVMLAKIRDTRLTLKNSAGTAATESNKVLKTVMTGILNQETDAPQAARLKDTSTVRP